MRRTLLVVLILAASAFAHRLLYGQSQLKQLNDELVQIARKLAPSVVDIEFEGVAGPRIFRQEGGGERGQWRAEVQVDAGEGGTLRGSGVIMTPDGFILTASDHLRGQGEPRMKVTLADGRSFAGKLVGRDSRTGLAAVKIDVQGLSAVLVAEKSPPVGSLVVALGDTASVGKSMSLGVVSGTERVVGGEGPGVLGSSTQYAGLLQITNPVTPSDVGGLAADIDGRMVGMLQSSLTGRPRLARLLEQPGAPVGVQVFGLGAFGAPTVQGVSFATPVEVIRRVFDTLRRGEKVQWGYLGVYFTIAKNEGLRVSRLMPDGPAAAA
jgi:S1-C subfamily serine protease